MKTLKMILTSILLTGFVIVANAQDVITKKNGDEIQAKVLEVGVSDVKYKKINHTSGPTYTLAKSDIFMIRYENGDKDMFDANNATDTKDNKPAVQNAATAQNSNQSQSQSRAQTQAQTQTRVATTPQVKYSEPVTRKGYIGMGVGGAFLTEGYTDVDAGVQFNINFGYLFSKHVGIASSFLFTTFDLTSLNDVSIGLVGLVAGPLFTFPTASQKVEFDLRPMIGYASGVIYVGKESVDEGVFVGGVGSSVRWNCASRVSLSGNFDYYYGNTDYLNLSSLGFTIGVNFRF